MMSRGNGARNRFDAHGQRGLRRVKPDAVITIARSTKSSGRGMR
jgi:hypothetical protein